MKNSLQLFAALTMAAITLPLVAGSALAGPDSGTATFTSADRTYQGQFTTAGRGLSVEIDGVLYRGHYASRSEDDGGLAASPAASGQWGRAFLFASSANILQCRLETNFPQVRGLCRAADGREFDLKMPAVN